MVDGYVVDKTSSGVLRSSHGAAANERLEEIHAAVQTHRLTRPEAEDHLESLKRRVGWKVKGRLWLYLKPVEALHGTDEALDVIVLDVAGEHRQDLALVGVLALDGLKTEQLALSHPMIL